MGTQSPAEASTALDKLAIQAWKNPQGCFTNLHQYLTLGLLYRAWLRTRKDGAAGVDGVSAEMYAAELRKNLQSLLDRAHNGSYRAPPVKRAYVPKAKGEKRPIGIPTLEDKILQRAVVMILENIYEQDFHPDSFGFRPRRSQHMALRRLRDGLTATGGGYVIELDIRAFFDNMDKTKLRTMLDMRIGDGIIRRLIHKWLKAGVMDKGIIYFPRKGSPQGGVISPLLANLYLHHVLDLWFATKVQPNCRGRCFHIRYADDAVLGFSSATDAQRVMKALPKRFARFKLELHSDKTRQLTFKPGQAESFDFLGFTHYWGRTRRGGWSIQRKTAKDRLRRTLKGINEWCRRNRHLSLVEQHAKLSRKLMGHFAYYGIRGNVAALGKVRFFVERIWIKWLSRRSQRGKIDWIRAGKLLAAYRLPRARVVNNIA